MKEWFAGLEPRERLTLIVGGALLLVALSWVLLIQPLYVSGGERAGRADDLRRDVARAQALKAEIDGLRSGGDANGDPTANESLLIIAENTARQSGLQVNQSRPMDASTVRVRFESVSFDALVSWMSTLATRYGVRVDIASLDRLDTPGHVDAQITLKRPAA